MSYLIDSDWVIDYLRGRPAAGLLVDVLLREGIGISVITHAEVYQGVHFGNNRERNTMIFRRFLRLTEIYPITRQIAHRYALLRGELRQVGIIVPPTDLLIAATAIHHDLRVVTRNLSHYERIQTLRIFPEDR